MKKCYNCGKEIESKKPYRHTIVPTVNQFDIIPYNKKAKHMNRTEIDGIIIQEYCNSGCYKIARSLYERGYVGDDQL